MFSGLFASSETAFFSLPTSRVHMWRRSSDRRKQMAAQLLSRSRQLLVLIFILNTIFNIFIQNASSDLSDQIGNGWFYKVALPFALILICGEFLPKYLGRIHCERLALAVAPLYTFLERFTEPLQRAVTHMAELLARLVFFFLKPSPPLSPKEIESVISTCQTHDLLSAQEGHLIRQSLKFEHQSVRDLMTPRSKMVAIRRSQISVDRICTLLSPKQKHEVLFVDEQMDRPLGALGGNELLLLQTGHIDKALGQGMKNIFFVPEVMLARRLLQEFSERRALIACVVDEHGTVCGYISKHELIHHLLCAPSPEQQNVWKNTSITLAANTTLDHFNALFQTDLSSEHHAYTIGGWLTEMLDGIPATGTSYSTESLIFRVLSADEKSVKQIFVQKNPTTRRA